MEIFLFQVFVFQVFLAPLFLSFCALSRGKIFHKRKQNTKTTRTRDPSSPHKHSAQLSRCASLTHFPHSLHSQYHIYIHTYTHMASVQALEAEGESLRQAIQEKRTQVTDTSLFAVAHPVVKATEVCVHVCMCVYVCVLLLFLLFTL